jgi:hypothetical protein
MTCRKTVICWSFGGIALADLPGNLQQTNYFYWRVKSLNAIYTQEKSTISYRMCQ